MSGASHAVDPSTQSWCAASFEEVLLDGLPLASFSGPGTLAFLEEPFGRIWLGPPC